MTAESFRANAATNLDFKGPVLFLRTALRSQCIKFAVSVDIVDIHTDKIDTYVILWRNGWFEVLRDKGSAHSKFSMDGSFHDQDISEILEMLFEEQMFGAVLDMQVHQPLILPFFIGE